MVEAKRDDEVLRDERINLHGGRLYSGYRGTSRGRIAAMRDEDVRASCFGHLAILCAQFGEDVPYRGGLDRGFPFRGSRVPGWYRPNFPFFVLEDDAATKRVLVAPGAMVGPLDEREPVLPEDPIERRYAVRVTRVR